MLAISFIPQSSVIPLSSKYLLPLNPKINNVFISVLKSWFFNLFLNFRRAELYSCIWLDTESMCGVFSVLYVLACCSVFTTELMHRVYVWCVLSIVCTSTLLCVHY